MPSPAMKRAAWPQQQYLMKCARYTITRPLLTVFRFIHRKITYGTNQSKLVIHAFRRRLCMSSPLFIDLAADFPRSTSWTQFSSYTYAILFSYIGTAVLTIHAARTAFVSNGSDAWETKQQERIGNSPILLPQLPLLSLPCLFPETTDSGYCS